MSEEPAEGESASWPDWMKPRRLAEFAGNVWRMERAVEELRRERSALRSEMDAMQTQLARQASQIETLVTFVQSTLNDRVDMQAENAALRVVAQITRKVRDADD